MELKNFLPLIKLKEEGDWDTMSRKSVPAIFIEATFEYDKETAGFNICR